MAKVVQVLVYEGPEDALKRTFAHGAVPVIGETSHGNIKIQSGILTFPNLLTVGSLLDDLMTEGDKDSER